MSSLPIAFGAPWYLLLIGLLPLVFWFTRKSLAGLPRRRRWTAIGARTIVVTLLIFALAEARWRRPNDRLAVIFIADLSESIPAERREAERQYIVAKAAERLEADDLVGVVAFGRVPGIEWAPKNTDLDLHSFTTLIEPQGTDIAAAIRLAAAAFPEGYGKRIALLTDGNENRGSVLEEVYNARALGVTVDVVPITYSYPAEISVEKLLVESTQHVGEPFDVRVVVESSRETEAILHLYENGQLVPQQNPRVQLRPGKNRFDFRGRRVDSVGQYQYEARLEPVDPAEDSIYQNNTAFGFTFVDGEPKLLVCTSDVDAEGSLLRALREEKITVDVVTPETLPNQIQDYFVYDGIVLSNVSSSRFSLDTMKMFESLVKTIGLGFAMLGGEHSFGAGAYKGTPIERLLPVEMDVKNKKVMPNGAIAFVVHSCELGNGNFWARQVIQQALKILSPRDRAGVISYDMGTDRWLFPTGSTLASPKPLWPVTRRREMLGSLNGFNPGDMPDFRNIVNMAHAGLNATQASIKHMLILSDGDPTRPTPAVIAKMRRNGITISTICYGSHGVPPAAMKAIAKEGGGKFYFLQSPDNLPEVFIRETTTITKSLINEESFLPQQTSHHPVLQGVTGGGIPQLDGYVLTSPKELASVPIVHPATAEDPTLDPVLALWSYGMGKSIAFTSDSGFRWAKNWTSWENYRRFWAQNMRWMMRVRSDDRFRVTRSIEGGEGVIRVDAFTPDGRFINGLDFDGRLVGPDFGDGRLDVKQVAPGAYEARFPLSKKGVYTGSFSYRKGDGPPRTYITGLSVPYSAEYRRLSTDEELLAKVAEAGDGELFSDPVAASFFRRGFPQTDDVQDVWHALLFAALGLFFLDVFHRRVAIDYGKVVKKAWQRTLEMVAIRKPELAPSDGRLATLLDRKEKLREATESRYSSSLGGGASQAAASQVPASEGVGSVAEESSDPEAAPLSAFSGKPQPPPRAHTAETKKTEAPAEEADAGETSYTARLLRAKKRALSDDEDSSS